MNEIINPENCEDFEILLSCSLDDELNADEQKLLSAHLAECSDCRSQQQRFFQVNTMVGRLGYVDESRRQTKLVVPSGKDETERYSPGSRKTKWSGFVPMAALAGTAAALLVWLGGSLPTGKQANGDEIVTTLVSLAEINTERQFDQEMLRNSLQLELRTLKLQIESLEDHEQTGSIRGQYEALLKKISKLEI